jgi:4'-phosphopantetheinyl transferase
MTPALVHTIPLDAAAQVEVWAYDLRAPVDEALLSPDEQARADRLLLPEKRWRFVAARCGLRRILSRYTDAAPETLVFEYGPQGKPSLHGIDGLHFNLTHSDDTALVAVAPHPVGVDLEHLRPITALTQTAQIAFSPQEQAALAALPVEQRTLAFFRTWTRKEALMKARGEGFKLAKTFSLPVDAGPRVIALDGWTIHDLPLPEGVIAAVAVAD